MTAFVLPSARFHTLMKLSRELEAAYVPLMSEATDMTPSVCPAHGSGYDYLLKCLPHANFESKL